MTIEAIELDYYLSAKDRLRAQDCLDNLSQKGQDSTLYFMTHPYVMPIVNIFLAYMCFEWLVRLVPRLFAGNLAELLQPSAIVGHLFGVVIILYLLDNLWQFLSRYWGQEKAMRAGHEGVNWGVHQLSATPDALSIRLAARRTVYSWAAFSGLERTKHMFLLTLTPRSAIAVPRWAFKSELEEGNFSDFVQSQITGA